MTWQLFIDDLRELSYIDKVEKAQKFKNWRVARTVPEALAMIDEEGCFPNFISFDHDLGEGQEDAIRLVHQMVEMDMLGVYGFVGDFDYVVHSANPVGADNIRGLLNGYLNFKQEQGYTR